MNRVFVVGLLLLAFAVQAVVAQPASTAPASTAPASPAPKPPAAEELIYQGEATSILGREVRDPEARTVGRIVDVLVDDSGQPRAAIIDFGGFMGVGDRHIAVAWRALHFAPAAGQGTITLEMTVDQIKATPEYRRPVEPAAPPVVVAVPPPPSTTPPPPAAAVPPPAVTPKP
jgi:hypothetical protein